MSRQVNYAWWQHITATLLQLGAQACSLHMSIDRWNTVVRQPPTLISDKIGIGRRTASLIWPTSSAASNRAMILFSITVAFLIVF